MSFLKRLSLVCAFLTFGTAASGFAADTVFIMDINDTINPVIAEYVRDGINEAYAQGGSAIVIKLDTPGGLMDSMRNIIKDIEGASLPVVVYVGDSGARAASAGAFITMASDLAVMAEGTNIGAAHPVKMGQGGNKEGATAEKATQDARAFMMSLAEKHGRNAKWAADAVTESLSITASEAVKMNVVEYEVGGMKEFRKLIGGMTLVKNGMKHNISPDFDLRDIEMGPFKQFLSYVANPNLAYIFLIIGIYGLIYEFANPGIGVGAVAGGIFLLIAALSFQMIPVNTVGILLIAFGMLLMLLDIWVPSYGILTAGGLVSFIFGSLTLIDIKSFPVDISLSLIAGATAATALFFIFALSSGIRVQNKKVTTGEQGMVGQEGYARTEISGFGEVFVRGEIWKAKSLSGRIDKGEGVVVKKVEGNLLTVDRSEEKAQNGDKGGR